ncbi:hypothetical protein ISCU110981_16200 [Isoptericola cucumis]
MLREGGVHARPDVGEHAEPVAGEDDGGQPEDVHELRDQHAQGVAGVGEHPQGDVVALLGEPERRLQVQVGPPERHADAPGDGVRREEGRGAAPVPVRAQRAGVGHPVVAEHAHLARRAREHPVLEDDPQPDTDTDGQHGEVAQPSARSRPLDPGGQRPGVAAEDGGDAGGLLQQTRQRDLVPAEVGVAAHGAVEAGHLPGEADPERLDRARLREFLHQVNDLADDRPLFHVHQRPVRARLHPAGGVRPHPVHLARGDLDADEPVPRGVQRQGRAGAPAALRERRGFLLDQAGIQQRPRDLGEARRGALQAPSELRPRERPGEQQGADHGTGGGPERAEGGYLCAALHPTILPSFPSLCQLKSDPFHRTRRQDTRTRGA